MGVLACLITIAKPNSAGFNGHLVRPSNCNCKAATIPKLYARLHHWSIPSADGDTVSEADGAQDEASDADVAAEAAGDADEDPEADSEADHEGCIDRGADADIEADGNVDPEADAAVDFDIESNGNSDAIADFDDMLDAEAMQETILHKCMHSI